MMGGKSLDVRGGQVRQSVYSGAWLSQEDPRNQNWLLHGGAISFAAERITIHIRSSYSWPVDCRPTYM